MTNGPVHKICTVPAGSIVTQVSDDDPLTRSFRIEQPDGVEKTITLGPAGIIVFESSCAPDMTIEIGIGDAKSADAYAESRRALQEIRQTHRKTLDGLGND